MLAITSTTTDDEIRKEAAALAYEKGASARAVESLYIHALKLERRVAQLEDLTDLRHFDSISR
jgi:hypothetical protein